MADTIGSGRPHHSTADGRQCQDTEMNSGVAFVVIGIFRWNVQAKPFDPRCDVATLDLNLINIAANCISLTVNSNLTTK
jgi:hypothetical protein